MGRFLGLSKYEGNKETEKQVKDLKEGLEKLIREYEDFLKKF